MPPYVFRGNLYHPALCFGQVEKSRNMRRYKAVFKPPQRAVLIKRLMRGNKWRLFCLELSFFGWALLSALTLDIGTFWLRPYEEAAQASFYRQICYERSNGATTTFPNFTYNPSQHNRPNSYNNQGPEL